MKDRVPLYPGRVMLTPVSGQESTYDMVRADEPTQEGTPLSKATFLKDSTASLFGLGSDAVPDDAFAALSRFHNRLGDEYVWEKSDGSGVVGYVNSPYQNAYPIDDGYTYNALGRLGEKVRISIGSYRGTSVFGESNPNILSFSFAPKFVWIYAVRQSNGETIAVNNSYGSSSTTYAHGFLIPELLKTYYQNSVAPFTSGEGNKGYAKKSADGKTFYWYHTETEAHQLNINQYTYFYIALG